MIVTEPRTWLSDVRERLVARRAELWADAEGRQRELAKDPTDRGEDTTPSQHPADVASDLETREFTLSTEIFDTREIRDIDDALARIDAGAYEACADCGQPISRERLEVLPYTQRDVACARRWEKERARSRS